MWDKDIVECMIRRRDLVWHLTKSFQKGKRLNQKLKMKICKLGDVCKQLVYSTISQMEVWGQSPSCLAIFLHFFGKKAILMPLDHISHVFRTI